MAQRDELKALRDEIAELHKKIEALTEAMLQLAVNTPQPYYYPVPSVFPQPIYPYITYSGGDTAPTTGVTVWNGGGV